MIQKLSNRFDQLADEAKAVETSVYSEETSYGGASYVDEELLLAWSVEVMNLLELACGKESPHHIQFLQAQHLGGYETNYNAFKRMRAIFGAATEDFKGGYLTSVKTLIQADVFETELDQAQELLASGYRAPAAVAAGIVLETALRQLCDHEGHPHSALDKMNADLAKAGTYNSLQQKRITALADIRNRSAHGQTTGFSDEDVRNMIREIEVFLANHFS